jgi:hypothetical protein
MGRRQDTKSNTNARRRERYGVEEGVCFRRKGVGEKKKTGQEEEEVVEVVVVW